MDIREELEQLKDEKYKDFHSALLPTVEKDKIIGVRLPKLRKVAARIKEETPKGVLPDLPQGVPLLRSQGGAFAGGAHGDQGGMDCFG